MDEAVTKNERKLVTPSNLCETLRVCIGHWNG